MDKAIFIAELSKLRPNSTFLTLNGYRNDHSEISNYNILFHISYKNALAKSISILQQYIPADDLEVQAKNELIESFNTSLTKIDETEIEDIDDAYTRFFHNGNYVKGIKLHDATNTLHIYGLVSQKKVLIPGTYPKKNKRPLTVAKDRLRNLTSVGKFRQFKITPENVDSISVENLNLIIK